MGNTWVRNTLGFGTLRYRRFYDQKLPLLNAARSETKGLHCDSDFTGPFGSHMFIMVTTECAEGSAAECTNTFGAVAYSEKISPGDDHLPRHPARTRSATAARNGSGFRTLRLVSNVRLQPLFNPTKTRVSPDKAPARAASTIGTCVFLEAARNSAGLISAFAGRMQLQPRLRPGAWEIPEDGRGLQKLLRGRWRLYAGIRKAARYGRALWRRARPAPADRSPPAPPDSLRPEASVFVCRTNIRY
jgi:hypothetical protein